MAKVSIQTIENLQNESAAIGKINANFAAIAAGIELLLSRDGTSPNQMAAVLDMNNRRIINLPVPISDQEPARHGDIQTYVDQAEAWAEVAETEADRAETEANRAEDEADEAGVHETNTLAHLNNFLSRYLGAYATDPTVNPHTAAALTEGAIYFNTAVNNWRVWNILSVYVDDDAVLVGADSVEVRFWKTFPQSTLRSLTDVSADNIVDDQLLVWRAGQEDFAPLTLNADAVPFDDTTTALDASTVQGAIEDLVARTSLGAYDISFYAENLIADGEVLFQIVAAREFVLPVNLANSKAVSVVAANNTHQYKLYKNDTLIGTINFTATESTGTFTVAAENTFAIGDVFKIVAPDTADTALQGLTVTVVARR